MGQIMRVDRRKEVRMLEEKVAKQATELQCSERRFNKLFENYLAEQHKVKVLTDALEVSAKNCVDDFIAAGCIQALAAVKGEK